MTFAGRTRDRRFLPYLEDFQRQTADPLVPKIVEALQRVSTRRVDDLAGDLFLSPRQLRRRCLIAFGCGPKALQRVLRFQRYLALSHFQPETSLALLAIEAGYADQAHLTHDAVNLAGVPPTKLRAETWSSCGPYHQKYHQFARISLGWLRSHGGGSAEPKSIVRPRRERRPSK